MAVRHKGVRSTVALGIASLLAAGLVSAESASARTKTDYYSASTDVSSVRYATTAVNATTVTFTITNCGSAFAPPGNCAKAKGTSIDSVVITLPTDWSAVSAASLTASGLKLAPGDSVQMPVQVLPSATGAGTAQNVGICVSDTTLCSYEPTSATQTLMVPLRFSFTQSPADGMPSSSLCGTKAQLTDAPAGTDSVPLEGVGVRLAAATGSLNPGFAFDGTNTPSTDATGLATFTCSPNPAVGGPYSVVAVAQSPAPTIPSDSSSAFVVFTTVKNCSGGCSNTENGGGGTRLDATSNATGVLGTSVFDAADSHYPTYDCAGAKKITGRPDVLQASSDGDKTVVITWSKQITLKFTDNGTPHWQVCMQAPATFITDSGVSATQVGSFFVGTIPLCGAAGLPAGNPCMVVSRNAAQEIATITLPASWTGDPYFH
jgi:hypothetical protein